MKQFICFTFGYLRSRSENEKSPENNSIFTIIITIAVLAYYLCIKDKNANLISDKEIQNKNFLDDKRLCFYFSSTADQDLDGKGISYAIFINKQGVASGYKMGGLELGGIGVSDDKNKFY